MLRSEVGPYTGPADDNVSQNGSRMSKTVMKRFNEAIPEAGPRSLVRSSRSRQSGYAPSKAQSQNKAYSQTKSVQQSIFKRGPLNKQLNEQLPPEQIIESVFRDVEVNNPAVADQDGFQISPDEAMGGEGGQTLDVPEDVNQMDSVSQVKPTQSMVSMMSGKTYISQLQKQLNDEKYAREKLESELQELKKISSEISSQLGALQKNGQAQ